MSEVTEVVDDDAGTAEKPEPERLHGALVTHGGDATVLHVTPGEYLAVVKALRADGYYMCIDVCGVDYLTHSGRSALPAEIEAQRFEVVAQFLRHSDASRARVRVQVDADEPTVPTITGLFPGAEGPERETWDMFGIVFDGHPDLTRILMPDEWTGHPLRKDYSVGRIPVQFKAAPIRGDREGVK
ncbi:MAG: NADH-quinone oxidoreductase subunit C [Microthrixaceae bacterium]